MTESFFKGKRQFLNVKTIRKEGNMPETLLQLSTNIQTL